jgi:hypothetical protein
LPPRAGDGQDSETAWAEAREYVGRSGTLLATTAAAPLTNAATATTTKKMQASNRRRLTASLP